MGIPPKGLIVTPDLERAGTWIGWLRKAGYMSLGCVGPGLTLDCPRLRGDHCSVRESVSVAIVDLDSDVDARLCTKLPDDGSTVFVRWEGSGAGSRASVMDRVHNAPHRAELRGRSAPSPARSTQAIPPRERGASDPTRRLRSTQRMTP